MRMEIISVHTDQRDPDCLVVTLRHVPGRIARWFGARERVVTYKGQTSAWYVPPSYRKAGQQASRFLDDISTDHAYAHLRAASQRAGFSGKPATRKPAGRPLPRP